MGKLQLQKWVVQYRKNVQVETKNKKTVPVAKVSILKHHPLTCSTSNVEHRKNHYCNNRTYCTCNYEELTENRTFYNFHLLGRTKKKDIIFETSCGILTVFTLHTRNNQRFRARSLDIQISYQNSLSTACSMSQ